MDLRYTLAVNSIHTISNLPQNILLQTMRKVIRVGEVKADFVHLKLLEQVDKIIFIIAIGIM